MALALWLPCKRNVVKFYGNQNSAQPSGVLPRVKNEFSVNLSLFFFSFSPLRSVWVERGPSEVNFFVMPLISFDRILKIILTILNVLSAALRAFDLNPESVDQDEPDSTGSA